MRTSCLHEQAESSPQLVVAFQIDRPKDVEIITSGLTTSEVCSNKLPGYNKERARSVIASLRDFNLRFFDIGCFARSAEVLSRQRGQRQKLEGSRLSFGGDKGATAPQAQKISLAA